MSNIAIGSSFRHQPNSVATAHLSEEARGSGVSQTRLDSSVYTRAPTDGVGRPYRGPMQRTEISRLEPIHPDALEVSGMELSRYFGLMTGETGSARNQVTVTMANGETATITGTSESQNIRCRRRNGVVVEVNTSSHGVEAIRGLRTPREVFIFLHQVHMADGWAGAQGLPDR